MRESTVEAPAAEALDGARLLGLAREIAFPRRAGTAGNERAREILTRRLTECGLEVRSEWFTYDLRPAMRAIRLVLSGSALLVLCAGWLSLRSAGAAFIVLAAGAALGGVMLVWAPGAERLYRRDGPTRTANVVARRPVDRPRSTLILMAHYDSKSQSLTFPFRMAFTLAAICGGAALGAVLALASAGVDLSLTVLAPCLASIAAASLLALATMRSGNRSPGGVDNAGSVATVLELGRVLPREIGPEVELIILCTSAEEDHMIGAMRYLDAHLAEFRGRPVNALNFDGAGSPGDAVLLESYGLGHRFAPEIARIARATARRAGVRLRRVWMPPAMGVDAIPFHHRGVPCLTFSSGSLGRATIAVHSASDVVDHLDAATLARVASIGRDVARSLGAP